ncbi:hypothetical protein ABFS82_06G108500 [Erythranthe guttata]|uniref:procollagen-proline 4-dioxygenase n=1 Tax=Erythranthe guttata TaxID=4155 RepID=A0A022PVM2_ERYGU|nr:PREDICTED: probable prolyl 4-hydroxylase 12 isoform X1 [Erythranthe guttata]EYU19559.1 hypothetical protein MIMGU_mgv1a010855mg [Erythranthe guttata]|eukprot:XP_012858726.1 PREDICTED: probable prolyl 4-hydroxylase 12 isoform X1 [Erythranthe guttata]
MATHLTILGMLLLAITFGISFAQNSRKELRTKETNQDQIIRLGNQVQSKSIDPSRVTQISWQPRVFLYRDFLYEEECDYLISRVNGERSYTVGVDDSTKIDANKDEIATRIEERISAWTFLPKENSKSLQVLHFGPENPKQNYNYFHNESAEEVGQPLLATVILYLSNVSQGGQIIFPQSKKTMWSDCTKSSNILKPSKGNAVVFFNLHLNATPDTSSVHARCPVLQGDIWFATKFFYLKEITIGVEKEGQSRSDGGDCTDEDESCSRWAAIGECQRNSVFMIGSPDYYGTCRKSCNAC